VTAGLDDIAGRTWTLAEQAVVALLAGTQPLALDGATLTIGTATFTDSPVGILAARCPAP
jgi:hypothetical protein